jgi:S-adenosylmethionine:tRNA ribosyltransferase-isomerase
LRGTNAKSGGQFEVLLLTENAVNDWWVMLRPGKRARIGTQIVFHDLHGKQTAVRATVLETNAEGHRRLRFDDPTDIKSLLDTLGEVPLPPYIRRKDRSLMQSDRERYQTVFARPAGSVAAPTAGLHFTEKVLQKARQRGVRVGFVTLHVGLGTFAPVKTEIVSQHVMHEEVFQIPDATALLINETKQANRKVVAVGTTTLRVLESVAANTDGLVTAGSGSTRIFIHPPYHFKVVDALLTNFHLPRSTLLMLVSAFAAPGETRGRDMILSAYSEAIREKYRFFSYGDAMLII